MDAYYKITQSIESTRFPTEKVRLSESLNHILQEDIIADMNMPPFDKSAMDGFACRKEDLGSELMVLETIQAGKLPSKTIGKNQCSKIMTGAAVPDGANCVFMTEDAEPVPENSVKCINPATKTNICFTGEDYKKGDVLINKGVKIGPGHVGTMASAGYHQIAVSNMPTVGIMATGTELVEPSEIAGAGKIRNSNSYQLMAQLKAMEIDGNYLGIFEDDFDKISRNFEAALYNNDLVIITGGASQGDFDFVPAMLQKQGFEVLVQNTGIQPGNPMTFSKKEAKYCFGLSGNPVSSFVQFELFVKPFLYKLLGSLWQPTKVKGKLAKTFSRKKGHRFGIIPVKMDENNRVTEIGFHGSAHINALAFANALMEIPKGVTHLNEGEEVDLRLI